MFKHVLKTLFSTFITKKKETRNDFLKTAYHQSSDSRLPVHQKEIDPQSRSTPSLPTISKHDTDFLSYLFGESSACLESDPFSDFIAQKIEALLLSPKGLLKELPVMPASVITLMSELKKDDFQINELLQVIEREPGMAADVIKIANSPLYRRSEKTITDLKTVFMNIGANALLDVVVYSHLKKLSPGANIYFKHFGDKIWLHCLQTALFSKLLIEDTKNNEEKSTAYLVGLLLNLGKMIIFQIMIEAFSHVHPDVKPNSQAFKSLISMHSTRLTYSIAKFWQLPETIIQAIALQNKKPSSQNHLALAICEANLLSELEFLLSADKITDSEFSLRVAQGITSEKGKAFAIKMQQQPTSIEQ